jgi:hypothetical protein
MHYALSVLLIQRSILPLGCLLAALLAQLNVHRACPVKCEAYFTGVECETYSTGAPAYSIGVKFLPRETRRNVSLGRQRRPFHWGPLSSLARRSLDEGGCHLVSTIQNLYPVEFTLVRDYSTGANSKF